MLYPSARRAAVVETLHGVEIADPYRWLEDPDSAETQRFIAEQTNFARRFLDEVPQRASYKARLSELYAYEQRSAPWERGARVFFWQQLPGQNQPCMVMVNGDSQPQVVLDPNALSADGTVAVTVADFSDDGKYLAYALTFGGSDWQELRVRNVETGRDFDERIQWVRFPAIAWAADSAGFYYNGFEEPPSGLSSRNNLHNQLRYHALGTPHSADKVVYAEPDRPTLQFSPRMTPDKQYLVLYVWHAAIQRNRLYLMPLSTPGTVLKLDDSAESSLLYVGNDEQTFYFLTDRGAEKRRLVAVDIDRAEPDGWCDIVGEQDLLLQTVSMACDKFILRYVEDGSHFLRVVDKTGEVVQEIHLPQPSTILSQTGKRFANHFYFSAESFVVPKTVYRFDLASSELSIWFQPERAFSAEKITTTLDFATSKDGTRVPLFITHHQEIQLDGRNPTILYGYGGFSNSVTPIFKASRLLWLEQGGIYVQALLRGGLEYGDAWHKGGMLGNKQNVFDDFIGSAEFLIERGYTSTPQLAIEGRSNGGLLVAACMLQRPDLFGAVLCHVPVIDMLRYHLFTAGRYWTAEYGDPDDADHFTFLHAYSPLHNIEADVSYPPTIIFTADKDDRVVPSHAHKFAAALQAADRGDNPLLLRFETGAGHGFGKPTSKLIDEAADQYSFLAKIMSL